MKICLHAILWKLTSTRSLTPTVFSLAKLCLIANPPSFPIILPSFPPSILDKWKRCLRTYPRPVLPLNHEPISLPPPQAADQWLLSLLHLQPFPSPWLLPSSSQSHPPTPHSTGATTLFHSPLSQICPLLFNYQPTGSTISCFPSSARSLSSIWHQLTTLLLETILPCLPWSHTLLILLLFFWPPYRSVLLVSNVSPVSVHVSSITCWCPSKSYFRSSSPCSTHISWANLSVPFVSITT